MDEKTVYVISVTFSLAVFLMMCLRDCCQGPTRRSYGLLNPLSYPFVLGYMYLSYLIKAAWCFSITTHSHWLLMRDSISVAAAGRRSSSTEVCYLVSGSSLRSLSANVVELLLLAAMLFPVDDYSNGRQSVFEHVPAPATQTFPNAGAVESDQSPRNTSDVYLHLISMVTAKKNKPPTRKIKRLVVFCLFCFCFLIGNWTRDDAGAAPPTIKWLTRFRLFDHGLYA